MTPAQLFDEGVVSLGIVPGTSVLYVETDQRVFFTHMTWLPNRKLDGYAVQLAVAWISMGGTTEGVSDDLGVDHKNLRLALEAAGYERKVTGHPGNRRGKLVLKGALP